MSTWRPIPGYEGLYDVSSDGRVRSYWAPRRRQVTDTPRLIGGGLNGAGYLDAFLTSRDGLRRHYPVHRLVMLAFIGPPPEGQEVRHLNGVRTDARLENLAYGTRSENCLDRELHNPRTHCKRGHEFTPENTYMPPRGERTCRICRRAARAKWKARHRT